MSTTEPLSARNPGELLTLAAVADRLSVSVSTVKKYIAIGELQYTDLSAGNGHRSRRRVSEYDLHRFVSRRTQ